VRALPKVTIVLEPADRGDLEAVERRFVDADAAGTLQASALLAVTHRDLMPP